jgi:hypothetical protein
MPRVVTEASPVTLIKQIQIFWNVGGLWVLSAVVLWLGRGHLWEQRSALSIGILLGGVASWLWWRHLARRIARRDRRYERNKIFVDYLYVLPALADVVALVWFTTIL